MKSIWRFNAAEANGDSKRGSDRLRRLARNLDALAGQDRNSIRQAHEIGALRRRAAGDLHCICSGFVRDLNQLLSEIKLEFDPERYDAESFREGGANLFQINACGRILQIEFAATPELTSTEDFRVPYTLAGAVRCFNQELLEKDLIEEQLLYYTVEKSLKMWRFFDARTYRSGPFDADYLAGLMEKLV